MFEMVLNTPLILIPTPEMVKHTQTICRLLPANCLGVFDHFLGLALKGLKLVVDRQLL